MPNGREMRMWSRSICVSVALCDPIKEKSGTVRPFCSSEMVRAVKRPPGAETVTSTAPVWPTKRSGWLMVIAGGAPRPAA